MGTGRVQQPSVTPTAFDIETTQIYNLDSTTEPYQTAKSPNCSRSVAIGTHGHVIPQTFRAVSPNWWESCIENQQAQKAQLAPTSTRVSDNEWL